MKIEKFRPFYGVHCESTATGNLLKHAGLELSEAMIFGLGEGLSFLLFPIKGMKLPFVGGRCKTFELTQNLCRNLGLELREHETSSAKKAWDQISSDLSEGRPVGLQLDSYHLEYFSNKIHFAGHFVAMYGYDSDSAFLIDTAQQGGNVTSSLASVQAARNEKGPMSARNRSYTISAGEIREPGESAIIRAIKQNATAYLNPPITNFTFKGIRKFAKQVESWYGLSDDPQTDLPQIGMLMERAGTGGALFRNLYRDFLTEAYERSGKAQIKQAAQEFADAASDWTACAELFERSGTEADPGLLGEIAALLTGIAEKERGAMELLDEM